MRSSSENSRTSANCFLSASRSTTKALNFSAISAPCDNLHDAPRRKPQALQNCRMALGWPCRRDRPLLYRQVHDRREDAERNAEPPDHVVGTGLIIEQAAEPDAEECAYLMGEEHD